MSYEIDKYYDFKVLNTDSPTAPEFEVELAIDGSTDIVKVPKLPFQRDPNYIIPHSISFRVKSIGSDGLPRLAHNISAYVHNLYLSTYVHGEVLECEVVSVPTNPAEEPFTIRDKNGIFYRLDEPDGLMTRGQIVHIKFTQLTPRYFNITRIDEYAKLPFYNPLELFYNAEIPERLADVLIKQLYSRPEFEDIQKELREQNPIWIISTIRRCIELLPSWLKESKGSNYRFIKIILQNLQQVTLYLLEGSSYLNAAHAEQRRTMQDQLTQLVESLEPYSEVLAVIADNNEDQFVERILTRLQRSGYLYHPSRQFAVLMIIFRLYPEKVADYLGRIFESIFGRDLENWKREPFRSAFVEQFELYVQLARQKFDSYPIAETRQAKAGVETIVTAIALQILLEHEHCDLSRTWALFYRYVALLRPLNTEALLTKAFISLLGGDLKSRLTYAELKEPMMMMTQATVLPSGDPMSRIQSSHLYSGRGIDVLISSAGIQVRPTNVPGANDRVIPEGFMSWLKPQIYTSNVKGLTGNRIRKLSEHNIWWHNIEKSLIEDNKITVEESGRKDKAGIGDHVYIVVDDITGGYTNNATIHCHIQDNDFCDGIGTMKREDIVGYNMNHLKKSHFMHANQQLGFLAKVTNILPDGSYTFSLREEVDEFIQKTFNYDDSYTAVIASFNGRDYSAICDMGIGLFIEGNGEREHSDGDIIKFKFNQITAQGSLRGYVIDTDEELSGFDKEMAFNNLLKGIGVRDEAEEEETFVRDMDEILLSEDIREIINIIRFKIIAESDLIKAYDYLRFTRILAIAIGDDVLADKLLTHASLLILHQYFEPNNCMDSEKLEALRDEVAGDPLLELIFHRLEMVSWLKDTDRNEALYKSAQNPQDELEGTLARLILSYNMLCANPDGTENIAKSILDQIKDKLNVNTENRTRKYYGSESKYLEFKTSMVYCATLPGMPMKADPAAQQLHILSRIAGFLNADGGRLYIGVNNDGYEVGLAGDFDYYGRHRVSCGNGYFHSIKTLDNLTVFIENLINAHFPPSVARKISVSVDEEAAKNVIMIEVQKSLDPVFLNDRLWVRQSGQSTHEYFGKDIEDFKTERALMKEEHNRILSQKIVLTPIETPKTETVQAEVKEVVEETSSTTETEEAKNGIATSHWRHNVLHEYEDGYEDLAGYLYFLESGEVQYSTVDLYRDTAPECQLALGIPHRLTDAYLILGYESEAAVKVPIEEIITQSEIGNKLKYNDESKLLFAALAAKDDALMVVGADSGNALSGRMCKLSAVDTAHVGSIPKRVHNTPIHHTVLYEIVDSAAIPHLDDFSADNMSARRFGYTLRSKENTPGATHHLNELFTLCSHSV